MDRHGVTVSASPSTGKQFGDALHDLAYSTKNVQIWSALAWQDILARYRGSLLGPFWITLSMAALIGGMSLLYSQLLHIDPLTYVPYLGSGIVVWGFISGSIQEAAIAYTTGSAIIRQSSIPMFTFIWRTIYRNIIVLGHNLIIVVAVLGFSGAWIHINLLALAPGFLLVIANLTWICALLALFSARYKDVPQIIAAVLQLAFFLTPIFWRPESITHNRFVLDFNPLYHMLELVRAPLMGMPVPATSWSFSLGLLVFGWLLTFPIFAAQRRRIVHYL